MPWAEVRGVEAGERQVRCFGCQGAFPAVPEALEDGGDGVQRRKSAGTAGAEARLLRRAQKGGRNGAVGGGEDGSRAVKVVDVVKDVGGGGGSANGIAESGRYACTSCGTHFCIDCDVFCHAEVHNCPGCLGRAANGGRGEGNEARQTEAEAGAQTDMPVEVGREILELLAGSLGPG